MASAPPSPVIVGKKTLAESRFLRLVDISYKDTPDAAPRSWQSSVAVFAVIRRAGCQPRLLIVKQFRPPLGCHTVELVAGLVDPGESVETSALRELLEETGYTGRVVSKSGVGAMSPGLTPESIVTLYVEIDGDAPENAKPLQSAEDAGMITVETLPLDRLHESLTELEAQGFGIWVGLWSIAQALKMRSWLGL